MTNSRAASMLERLAVHQDRALDVAMRAEAMLAQNDPALAGQLAQARWELMRALMPYAAFKHGELFPAMIATGSPDQAGSATALRDDCLALGEAFKAYVTRWSSVSVPDHWDEYRPAGLAMIARLKLHMKRERRTAETILAALPDRRVPFGRAV